ncbi:Cna B-type domain-containing protein [Enterococcus casseliflavus]|uniref:Cna B-type domain-containing protein n=1 Tax=Enterococcus casseliflavus TaxID=37734 RepID=UPI00115C7260|nr:Cna B-type domain-containing protein [Enterococcus casseliflavus]
MSKKNNYRKLLRSNKSERYKMYKSGKHWVYATITSFTGIAGLSITPIVAHASEITPPLDASKEANAENVLANKTTTKIPASSTQESEATSLSESTQPSESFSESESNTQSQSATESTSLTESQSVSDSEIENNVTSIEESQSVSESMSLSEEESVSESESLSISESTSISESGSLSSSASESTSLSMSRSTSVSHSTSVSQKNPPKQTVTEKNKVESQKAQELFDQLVPKKVQASVDTTTNSLEIVVKDGNSPSTSLIRAAQQYASANNLIASFAITTQSGQIIKINVSADPDMGREEFEQAINDGNKTNSPSGVTVDVPDQVKNKDLYKQTAIANGTYAAVNDWATLKAAYGNSSITYIEVTANITAATNVATRDLGWRETSVIIDGNGFTVNMAGAAFNVGASSTVRGSIFTITNINLIHWQSGTNSGDSGTGTADAVIDSRSATGGYGYWYFNIDNVTLEGRDGVSGTDTAYQPRRLLDAEDSQVTLSGKIVANVKQELMQIGEVAIANGSHVELNRTAGTTGYSMFYYMAIRGNNASDTGFNHTFKVGDGATIIGNELSTYNSNNYPLVYYGFNSITVGDDVTWKQDGFQMLLDFSRYSGSQSNDRTATFGQNLQMTATRTVGSNSLNVTNRAIVTFNAGTVLDLQQWNANTVVNVDSGATIRFISPRALHLARLTSSGAVSAGRLITGSGTFVMNNSQISTWQGSSSQTDAPEGNRNLKFVEMTISGTTTTIKDTAGNVTTSNIVDTSTRELATVAIAPGTVTVNYVDQYGNIIKTVDMPIDPDVNYIGEYLDLQTLEYANELMPDNYMWAIGTQVASSAKNDGQSGGDSTTDADNGDSYGQATVAIVPMENTNYTYNIYVYGVANNSVQYQYVDVKTGQVISSEYMNAGTEASGTDRIPANYGNVIDWTNSYYTSTNLPPGYYYATGAVLNGNVQPGSTTVGTGASLTTIYVVADTQTVNVTFVNSDGRPLQNQTGTVAINGTTGQEISYTDLIADYLTQTGYYADQTGTFVFDNTSNNGSTTDSDQQFITITLYPSYQEVGVVGNNQPASDPATGEAFEQIPGTVTVGKYGTSGVSNESITLGVTDADLERNGYIYTVTGPDGVVYNTLAEALAANQTFDTTSNGASQMDSSPQMFTVNYEQDPVSLSTSESVSGSESLSESIITSTSESESVSLSQSISESDSLSESISVSDSESMSTSTSESVSVSESESDSLSSSISESESDMNDSTSESLSTSVSTSSSLSDSESVSISLSDSESASLSISESISVSDSESGSSSTSISESESMSLSISISDSESLSESLSESISTSISLSDSDSMSESLSASESLSISASVSESDSESDSSSFSASVSGSLSNSTSDSESLSLSESVSVSLSQSLSESTSLSLSESDSVSESISASESLSVAISESDSSSLSESISFSESISDSLSTSMSLSESLSESDSISNSISTSMSLSNSESTSESASFSGSTSVSNSDSTSASTSVSESTSTSVSESISTSTSVSDSLSLSNSESMSLSTSLSDSSSLSASISTSLSASDSASYSSSTSVSNSDSTSESISASNSLSVSNSESTSASTSISDSSSLSASISTSLSASDSASYSGSTSVSNSDSTSESISASNSLSVSIRESTNDGVYELQNKKTHKEVDEEVTNDDGQVIETDLPEGEYSFVETEAPDGYLIDTKPISFSEDPIAKEDQKVVVSLSKTELEKDTPITIKGLTKGTSPVLINVDTEGASTVNIKSQIKLEYTDGTSRNSHETEEFDDAVILWNFVGQSEGQTISINSPFQGTILDVGDTVDVHQNVDGSIIADTVLVNAETHRWDLQANETIVPTIKLAAMNQLLSFDTTTISGTKTWDDYDNKFNTRPASITVQLLQNGEVFQTKTVTPNKEGEWHYEFTDLPTTDESGQTYDYTIQETPVEGYTTKVNGYDLVNTYRNTETTDVAGTKTWDDYSNKFNTRPESITVKLMRNDKEIDDQIVKADHQGNWTYRFDNLPKYDAEGKEYTYTILEEKVSGYTTKVNGYDLVNTYRNTETTDVAGTKTWDDYENKFNTRPESITVKLMRNDKEIDDQIVKADHQGNWTYRFDNLPKYDAEGKAYTYAILEEKVSGYTTKVNGYDLVNTYRNNETTDVGGTKTWDDYSNKFNTRPESITVELMQNGKEIAKQVVKADHQGDWIYRFEDLPKYDAKGQAYTYSIQEVAVKGYKSDVHGYDLINTYVEPKTPRTPETPNDPSGPKVPTPSDKSDKPKKIARYAEQKLDDKKNQTESSQTDNEKRLPKTNEESSYELSVLGGILLTMIAFLFYKQKHI